MALMQDLLMLLENKEESFGRRLKIADSAFKSSEILLPHKELVLLEWILTNLDPCNKETWNIFYSWINSNQFKELNRNDVSNDEIHTVIELVKKNLRSMESCEDDIAKTIIDASYTLINNVTFQQYFSYNIEAYCELIYCILDNMLSLSCIQEFLKTNLFSKTLLLEEKFYKCLFDIILPVFTKVLLKFKKPNSLLEDVSRVVQKCIFYRNHDHFAIFINHFFENTKPEKHIISKILLKNILNNYEENMEEAVVKYKLIFNAFIDEYERDTELIYKFFIILVHITVFDLKEIIVSDIPKLEISKTKLSLRKSQEIILGLLEIFSEKNIIFNCKVKELTFTEFIRNILKQILYFNAPSSTSYKIFLKAIIIDPVVMESITEYVIIYVMMADNRKHQEIYESLIISIFELYSKLHRTENLVAKVVSVLNDSFQKKTIVLNEVYEFRGENDIENTVMETKNLRVENILTQNILDCFSTCICNLASWQLINVLKTLLHFLNKNLSNITNVTNDDFMYITYMEILSTFLGTFLSSIRVAEHTVAGNVVDKTVKELENLRNMLQVLGVALLNREHNHKLMQCFLNIAYHWAEVYIVLAYYSINNDVQLKKSLDNDFTSCNITYLHPYLNVTQWCLISERITNFGELPCKQLLRKLYIQKLKAMMLFEESVNDDLVSNVVKSITIDIDNSWKYILCDKFVINNLLNKMKPTVLLCIAEILINNPDKLQYIDKDLHILDAPLLLAAINYICITKINKLLIKQKRKLNENTLKVAISSKICSLLTDSVLLEGDHSEVIQKAKDIFISEQRIQFEWKINKEKMNDLLLALKRFPVIYSSDFMQKISLLYLCSLHSDLLEEFKEGKYSEQRTSCEDLIIGILQHNKSKMFDVLQVDMICTAVVKGYNQWEYIFSLIAENAFRDEYYLTKYESVVSELINNFKNPKYMRCCFKIVNAANKIKKTKMSKEAKAMAEKYKSIICDKVLEVVTDNNPDGDLVTGYAYALKHFLSQDETKLSKLIKYLDFYIEFAATDLENCENYLALFITVLQNKSKLQSVDDNFSIKIWNICKNIKKIDSRFEEYSQLLVLIFGLIPNEAFSTVSADLLKITDSSFVTKDYELLSKHLKTWESVISCNLNPTKTKILTSAVESLLQRLTVLLQTTHYEENLYLSIVNFEKNLIQTNHFLLTSALMDMLILNTTLIINKEDENVHKIFILVISVLEQLLNYRKPLLMDRLPPYLQQYRILLKKLCQKSNSEQNLDESAIKELSNCGHLFEKLTKNLVSCQKDMGRIGMYLIADILEQYEQISLHPNIKMHLNNCIYSFISICDQHAVTYLMRVLSNASTEIFKIMYDNYKRYYRFTGKI